VTGGGEPRSWSGDESSRLSLLAPASSAEYQTIVGDGDGTGLVIGLAAARFNRAVTERLVAGALVALERAKVAPRDVVATFVPGAFELPIAARALLADQGVDAVVCLGAVIRGETSHYDLVAGQCAAGCQSVQLELRRPVVFGVLTTDTLAQAVARSGGPLGDKGGEAVETAIEMALLLRGLRGQKHESVGRGRPVSSGEAVGIGEVAAFDAAVGTGVIRGGDGELLGFHCTAIASGSRSIRANTAVSYLRRPAHLGAIEAVGITEI